MPWQVEWTEGARDSLATVWLAATDRSRVTDCVEEADFLLMQSPTNYAKIAAEGLWLLKLPPLRFHLEIDITHHRVTIVGVSMPSES